MEKLLSFSVAAYNVEKTISKTLDSVLLSNAELFDLIEVLIVDDGSTDETFNIVGQYVSRYPNVFKYCKKTNGGHGSTLTYSIKNASGKYLRMLDGDDWVDTNALVDYMCFLQETDVDLIISPFRMINEITGETALIDQHDLPIGEELEIEKNNFRNYKPIHAHEFAIKTDLLRRNNVELTEHCSYTDVEFCFFAEKYAGTVIKFEKDIYQYRVGVNGQTVSTRGRNQHYTDPGKVAIRLLPELRDVLGETKRKILYAQIGRVVDLQFDNYLYLELEDGSDFNIIKELYSLKNEMQLIDDNVDTLYFANRDRMFAVHCGEYYNRKPLIIYGAGCYGRLAIRILANALKDDLILVDNSIEKQGTFVDGYYVSSPNIILEADAKNVQVLVALKDYHDDVVQDLLKMGVAKENILLP